MEKLIVKKWVETLRSGKYKQGKGALIEDDKYCCLGVACDMLKKELNGKWDGYYFHVKGESSSIGSLSHEMAKRFGISSMGKLNRNYKGGDGKFYNTLVELNDSGLSFKKIANIIEKNF